MLKVHEIFRSIQGESTYAGLPCVFVRLSGCNLSCSYCDTPEARDAGEERSVGEVLEAVRSLGSNLVAVTGGEPLAQAQTPLLVRRLLDEGRTVLIETNGTISLEGIDKRAVYVMDVKCPSSDSSGRTRWENIDLMSGKDEVKFVVASRTDYEWAKEVIAARRLTDKVKVLMSPVHGAIGPGLLAGWILADGLDVRLQVQLHKYLGKR